MAVSIYTTPSCSFCVKAKQWMRENRITFKEFDVSRDQRKADEMVRKSGQMGVPVVDVHGKVIVGFDRDKIERALKR